MPHGVLTNPRAPKSGNTYARMNNDDLHSAYNEAEGNIAFSLQGLANKKEYEDPKSRITHVYPDGREQVFSGPAYINYLERKLESARTAKNGINEEFDTRINIIEQQKIALFDDYYDGYDNLINQMSEVNNKIVNFDFQFETIRTGRQAIAQLEKFIQLWEASKAFTEKQIEYRQVEVDFVRINKRQRWIEIVSPADPFGREEKNKERRIPFYFLNPTDLLQKNLGPSVNQLAHKISIANRVEAPIVCRGNEREVIFQLIMGLNSRFIEEDQIQAIRANLAGHFIFSGLWHAEAASLFIYIFSNESFTPETLKAMLTNLKEMPESPEIREQIDTLDEVMKDLEGLDEEQLEKAKEFLSKAFIESIIPLLAGSFRQLALYEQVYELPKLADLSETYGDYLFNFLTKQTTDSLLNTDVASLRVAMTESAKADLQTTWATLYAALYFQVVRDVFLYRNSDNPKHQELMNQSIEEIRQTFSEGLGVLSRQAHQSMDPELIKMLDMHANVFGNNDQKLAVSRVAATATNPNAEASDKFFAAFIAQMAKDLDELKKKLEE